MSGDIDGSFELVREEEKLPSSAPIPVLDTREMVQVLVGHEHKQVLHSVSLPSAGVEWVLDRKTLQTV